MIPAMRQPVVRRLLAACVLAVLPAAVLASRPQAVYDVVIRHGRVLDGMGNPWIAADVAITGGRIARIGTITGAGLQELDAQGRYVSPGWIDMMDQSGAVLPKNGLAGNKLRMGVTSAIGGEGGTPVGADRVAEYFAGLEKTGISSTSAATSARRRRATRSSATRRARRTRPSSRGCNPSSRPPCVPVPWA
jgi:hypothetical protein